MPEAVKEALADEWFVTTVRSVAGGIDHSKSADQIDDSKSRVLTNVRPEGNILLKDSGYKKLQIAGVSTFLDVGELGGDTVMDVDSTVGFRIGGPVLVTLDSGLVHEDVIAAIAAGVSLTLTTGLPAGAAGNAALNNIVSNVDTPHEAVLGIPRKTFEYKFVSGVTETLLVTDVTLYIRRNLFWSMAPLDPRGSTAIRIGAVATDVIIAVDAVTEFIVGGPITIELDSGLAHVSTVVSTGAGPVITITDAIPGGAAAAIGNAVTSGGVNTTLTANEIAAATAITVANSVGLATGDVVSIILDDGSEHVTTVVSVAANLVNITTGLPSAASIGNALQEGMLLTGSVDKEVVFTTTNNGATPWTVFTNGVDPVARYDGVDVDPVPGLDGLLSKPLVDTCRTVTNHTGHLVLGATVEGGSIVPDRVRWGDTNDPTEWVTGNAGTELLRDTRDDIVAMLQLGQEVAIYRSRSIVMMEFQSDAAAALFFFRPVIFGRSEAAIGVGAVSANAVAPAGSGHIVLSHDGVYAYSGGLSLQLLSLPVDDLVFGAGGEIDSTLLHRSFVQFIDARNEVLIAYCVSGDIYPRKALILNMETNGFWNRTFTRQITSVESHSSTSTTTIAELEGLIEDQTWLLGSGLADAGSPVLLLTSDTSGNLVYEYDFISTTDDGTAIQYAVTTKQWSSFFKRMRWQWHQLRLGGSDIFVTADAGEGTVLIGFVSPGSISSQRFMVELLGERIQYSLAGVAAFSMGDIAFAAREETTDFLSA